MSKKDSMRDDLIRLVDPRPGHFLLESGDHGDLWLDLDRLFLRPRVVTPFASHLAARLSPFAVDAVCGPLVGGAFLAQVIASELDVTFCYTERRVNPNVSNGSARSAVAYHLPDGLRDAVAGKRIAVVDDAINAGHAVGGTIATLRSHGAEPVALGALLVVGAFAGSSALIDDLSLMSIATLRSSRWRVADCPLSARDVPLERPGG